VEKLLAIVQIKAAVLRDGASKEVPVEEIVPGDIVILNAGDIVPGDGLVQGSKDLFVDEAMLTGETFPIEKALAVLPAETPLGQRTNVVWMGTHVVSGSAKALVIGTGKETECGKLVESVISARCFGWDHTGRLRVFWICERALYPFSRSCPVVRWLPES
jgi:P-type Mg2+ transporter